MGKEKILTTYQSPQKGLTLPSLEPARGRPRDFIEWKTLRRWNRLSYAEQDVPGYLLKLVRTEAGISQKDFGKKMGISQQAVAQAERWSSNPTVSFMQNWMKACGKRMDIKFEDE